MKGNHLHAAKELSNAEEDLLFCTGEFGAENPEALQCTVWWLLALHFGFHAQDESKKLKWATLFFKQTPKWERTSGTVFLNTDLPSGE